MTNRLSNSFPVDLYIVYLECIDDGYPLTQNGYSFDYSNKDYDIENLRIDGPSVVAIIVTESPAGFMGILATCDKQRFTNIKNNKTSF